jgi:hypothetical protein
MSFLRHILRLFAVMLFSALGASMAFSMPMNTSEISFYQAENTRLSQYQNVGFAARAPPIAAANIAVTGGVTVMQGSAFALHGQETVAALLGFGTDHTATNNADDLANPGTRPGATDAEAGGARARLAANKSVGSSRFSWRGPGAI